MTEPPVASRSFARHCALVLLLIGTAVACKSSRENVGPTTSPSTTTTTSTTTSTTSTTSTTTTTTTPPTTTTIEVVVEGGVVKVANASGVDGAAGKLTLELAALGFQTREPTNAAGPDESLDVSKIYVKPGSEAVARSVAALMGGPEILAMPTPAWIKGATEALGDATVLVVLGHDLAGTDLAAMPG